MKRKEINQPDDDEVLSSQTDSNNEPKLKEQKKMNDETIESIVKTDEPKNTAVKTDEPKNTTVKTEKYDRQIRLWGEDGQQDLENANICLVNVTALGTEILKCLILPGIGNFTIIDAGKVTNNDLGSNFFIDFNYLGKSRAQSACELLQELNPDTTGKYVSQDPLEILSSNPSFYEQFSLVICSRLSEHNLLRLSDVLWQLNVPLVVCDNFGFLGYMRLVLKEHVIVNAQPDNALEDFRLDYPFVELQKYMENIDLDKMSKLEHSHTPYLILLYKYLQKWKKETSLDWPKSYSEKRNIRDMIREGIRKNEHGVPEIEENFDEAIKNCNMAFTNTRIPDEVNDIIQRSPMIAHFDSRSLANTKFWILVKALKEFVARKALLPVRGSLPDMFSDSKRYIELQNIYKDIAERDCQLLSELASKYLQEYNLPASTISYDDVKLFSKNAFFLRVITGLSLQDEMKIDPGSKMKDVLESAIGYGSEIYIVFRALNRFCNGGRYPFTGGDADNNADMQQLTSHAEHLVQETGINMSAPVDYFQELLRSNMCEMHAVASLFGGICAHEVIKVLTRQFIPVDNTVFFNGMTQVTSSIKL